MTSALTAAGAPDRNAVPSTTGRSTAVPSSVGPVAPGPARVPGTALSLLRTARQGLAEAESDPDPASRYVSAHLAALRAAAAIVAARGEPGTGARRRRPRSVWELLPQVAPALAEWAAFFAASAAKRAAAEAGLPRAASTREADDLLSDVRTFVAVAERALSLEGEPMLPLSLRHAS
ncbi:MAG: SAV_6107 family HEPN domain-containing protein [Trebonia sp.]